jgi:filamentous hemagglutinin
VADEAQWLRVLEKAQILVDPRKFREYVLVPGHASGKDRVFLELLGYRPRNVDDAISLARLYEEQARQRIMLEEVQFTGTQPNGRRFMIVVVVRGVALRSGWLLRHDGTFWLTTPFRGFARTRK